MEWVRYLFWLLPKTKNKCLHNSAARNHMKPQKRLQLLYWTPLHQINGYFPQKLEIKWSYSLEACNKNNGEVWRSNNVFTNRQCAIIIPPASEIAAGQIGELLWKWLAYSEVCNKTTTTSECALSSQLILEYYTATGDEFCFFDIFSSTCGPGPWTIRTLWSWTINNLEEYSRLNMLQDHIWKSYMYCSRSI